MTHKKRHNKTLTLFATLAVLIMTLMTAKAEQKPMKPSKNEAKDSISYNDQRRFQYYYYGAINEQTKGHYAAAFDLLNHCLTINPNASEAYFSRGTFYSLMKQDSLAELDQKKAVALSPDNNIYRERLAQLYIRAGRYDEAIHEYERLDSNNYNRSDVLAILLQLHNQNKDYKGMLRTLDRMETEDGASEQLTMQKMSVYDMMGDKAAAEAELKGLVQRHPYEANYKVMLGNWLLNNKREKEALQMFAKVLEDDPDNNSARMSMLDYLSADEQTELYVPLLFDLLSDKNTPDESRVTLVRQFITYNNEHIGDSTLVLQAFKSALSAAPYSSDLATLQAAYMEVTKMPQDSINNAYRTVLAIDPSNVAARIRLAQSLWNAGQYEKVAELCHPAIEKSPDEMAYYYFTGMAYSQLDKRDEALAVFKEGARHANSESNANLVSDFYSVMGDILHEKGLSKEAYEAYDSCLKWKPDNYACLNNYAYYLSLTDKDLAKAEAMSYQTIQAEPQNVTFLDTYAWVLFKQKRYEEARIYIEQAIKCDTDSVPSAVIMEHAGDINILAGYPDKALEYWKISLETNPSNALLQRKVKQKKYIGQ